MTTPDARERLAAELDLIAFVLPLQLRQQSRARIADAILAAIDERIKAALTARDDTVISELCDEKESLQSENAELRDDIVRRIEESNKQTRSYNELARAHNEQVEAYNREEHKCKRLESELAAANGRAERLEKESDDVYLMLRKRADEQRDAFLSLRSEWAKSNHPEPTWDASCLAAAKESALRDALTAIKELRVAPASPVEQLQPAEKSIEVWAAPYPRTLPLEAVVIAGPGHHVWVNGKDCGERASAKANDVIQSKPAEKPTGDAGEPKFTNLFDENVWLRTQLQQREGELADANGRAERLERELAIKVAPAEKPGFCEGEDCDGEPIWNLNGEFFCDYHATEVLLEASRRRELGCPDTGPCKHTHPAPNAEQPPPAEKPTGDAVDPRPLWVPDEGIDATVAPCGRCLTGRYLHCKAERNSLRAQLGQAEAARDKFLADKQELRTQLQQREGELAAARDDVVKAAGDLPVPLPEPGTDMARVLIANRIVKRERDSARADRDRARGLLDRAQPWIGSCWPDPRSQALLTEIRAELAKETG